MMFRFGLSIRTALGIILGFSAQNLVAGGAHSYYQSSRPAVYSSVFAIQSLEGEYGNVSKIEAGSKAEDANSRIWKGYGIKNGIGLELMKFTQFTLSHTLLDYRSKATSRENIRGSRFGAEVRFVFSSPIGNLEGGGGLLASRYEFQSPSNQSDYIGSGYYYILGLNHFLSSRVSFFMHGRMIKENSVRDGGDAAIENIKNESFGLGLGVKLWI